MKERFGLKLHKDTNKFVKYGDGAKHPGGNMNVRVMQIGEDQLEGLVDNMTLTLNYWINYDQLLHQGRPAQVTILQGVLQIMTAISPYLGEDQLSFYEDCQEIYRRMKADQD